MAEIYKGRGSERNYIAAETKKLQQWLERGERGEFSSGIIDGMRLAKGAAIELLAASGFDYEEYDDASEIN